MLARARVLYWDSDVWLSYVSAQADRISTIASLLQEVQDNDKEIIVTSIIAKVEVAFASYEKSQVALDPQVEETIDSLWQDPSIVEVIELNNSVALMARSLIRQSVERGWSLTPNDAVHLASAQWLQGVHEFHTYDTKLHRYRDSIGCDICEPYVLQPRLHE
jgi:predicted nucleic acid-binding protein